MTEENNYWMEVILSRYSDSARREVCCSYDSLLGELSRYANRLERELVKQTQTIANFTHALCLKSPPIIITKEAKNERPTE